MFDSYYVVENPRLDSLVDEVKEYIKAGWQPIGGIVAPAWFRMFYQAMGHLAEEERDEG
jgi:hypothetical protein